MTKKKMICFDMDGTIADLYNVEDWLTKIRGEDASPFVDAKPMWDMEKLRKVILRLSKQDWEIRVITWLSKDSTETFKTAVRTAKMEWLQKYNFPSDVCHLVQYGTTKANCVRHYAENAILIDDNSTVRKGWNLGKTIDPTSCDLIQELESLIVLED